MDAPASLVDKLRIDRDPVEEGTRHTGWTLAIAVVIGALVGAAAVWALFGRNAVAEPQAASARANAKAAQAGSTAPAPPSGQLEASGYVVARRQATVSAKITGKLAEIYVEEGQRVDANQILARLDDTNALASEAVALAQMQQAEAILQSANVALDDARPKFARQQKQFDAGVISAQGFDDARAAYNAVETDQFVKQRSAEVANATLAVAKRNHEDIVVRAPFGGVVTQKAAQPGEMISPVSAGAFTRSGICTIVDMDSLEVEVDVSENFIDRIRDGQAAVVRLNAYQGVDIPAEVIAVVPTADRSKATVRVRIGFKRKDPRILPEMGARVSFLSAKT